MPEVCASDSFFVFHFSDLAIRPKNYADQTGSQAGSDQQKSRIRPATTADRTRRTRPDQTNGTSDQTNGTSDQTNGTSDQTQDQLQINAARTCVPPTAASQIKISEGQNTIPDLQNGWSVVIDTPRLEGFPRKSTSSLLKHQEPHDFRPTKIVIDTPQHDFKHKKTVLDGFLPSRLD